MAGLVDVIESSLLNIVSKSAPLLGTVLGMPGWAGIGLSLIAKAFGLNSNDQNDIMQAISGTEDAESKLKQIETSNAPVLAEIAMKNFALETADKQSAREYGDHYKEFLKAMAIIVTIGFFGALGMVFTIGTGINEIEKELLCILLGMLASKWQTIIDFFYGASKK